MNVNPALPAVFCLSLALVLTGCPIRSSNSDHSESTFFVGISMENRVSGFRASGWGWKPGSRIEIRVHNEPTATGGVTGTWKKLFTVTVDADSMFGLNPTATFYPVARLACGHPHGQTVMFTATNLDTGRLRVQHVPADLYFSFNPC